MIPFLTRHEAFEEVLLLAERAARSQASVLLTGESGTGKTRLARLIHDLSPRRDAPFVQVPCANLPADLMEDEMFGHEKGAFTDARDERTGRFQQADLGTLFLDEIAELRPDTQAKVLRAVEEKRFERLGGNRTIEVDVRIVAATREDPDRLVAGGRLRKDLFYRLNVVRLHLPPLRERRGDVALLASALLQEAIGRHGLPPKRFQPAAMEVLKRYPWPGNVRELLHAVESAAVLSDGREIGPADLPRELSVSSPAMVRSAAATELSLKDLEEAYIDEVLERTRGNKAAAARILGIARKTLHEKLRARTDRGTAGWRSESTGG